MTVIARCHLKGLSPYGQSKLLDIPKKDKELPAAYEDRCWRERTHYDSKGVIYIPPMAFTNSIKEAAKYLSIKISSKGNQTYTKHFDAGVQVLQHLSLGVHKDEVKGELLFLNADGKRGGGTRVKRCMPYVDGWEGIVDYYIFDDVITKEIFEQVLRTSGRLIGIGFFRPSNRGFWGIFEPTKIEWIEN